MSITDLPAPPSRQDPGNFAVRGDIFMAALPGFVQEANALQAEVEASQNAAATSAADAAAQAAIATYAKNAAVASSNYKGTWSSLAGPLAIPASVLHNGFVWMLSSSLADVAAATPGVSAEWINVADLAGLGTAAYADTADFQPAIGALSGIVKANGLGALSAATAAEIVALIGALQVAAAATAAACSGNAATASLAAAIADGAVATAAKIAANIIPLSKLARVGTSGHILYSGGAGADPFYAAPPVAPVSSVAGKTGAVTLVPGDVGAAAASHTHSYAPMTAVVDAAITGSGTQIIRFTRASGATFDVNAGPGG